MVLRKLGIVLAIAALLAPIGSANHGQAATLVGQLGDGTTVAIIASYDSGDGDAQNWLAVVSTTGEAGTFDCTLVGSFERGFRSAGCATSVTIGGIGHFHPYLGDLADVHDVTLTVGAGSGTATWAIVG